MESWDLGIDLIIIVVLFVGIWLFHRPKSARAGNFTAAAALALAVVLVFLRHDILQTQTVLVALLIGAAAGWVVANRVNMLQIPAMVGLQNGAGGMASMLVSAIELSRHSETLSGVGTFSGIIGLIIGAATLSGSVIASGKLAGKIRQTPVVWPQHNWIFGGTLLLIILVAAWALSGAAVAPVTVVVLLALALALGFIFSIRVGGADMPVLISFLNSTSGLAAAFCGIVVQNRLLIACGATVAASGGILTQVMCRAMNRNLLNVFIGFEAKADYKWIDVLEEGTTAVVVEAGATPDPLERATRLLKEAETVIVVPGYGMALAQAQFIVNRLAQHLEEHGKRVRFAIHPVAGRMPGHMNVLLAEAEVPYDKLYEMKNINADFSVTDVAIVIGASDVVNPAAQKVKGTPISGMPILNAHEAKNIIICNLDDRPGYSGVRNSLYTRPNAVLLFGDAQMTLTNLLANLTGDKSLADIS